MIATAVPMSSVIGMQAMKAVASDKCVDSAATPVYFGVSRGHRGSIVRSKIAVDMFCV